MQYIELTIYVILPEPTAFKGVVERQAMVTFKGHPRVVVPLAGMLQQAAAVLGGRGIENATRGAETGEKKEEGELATDRDNRNNS